MIKKYIIFFHLHISLAPCKCFSMDKIFPWIGFIQKKQLHHKNSLYYVMPIDIIKIIVKHNKNPKDVLKLRLVSKKWNEKLTPYILNEYEWKFTIAPDFTHKYSTNRDFMNAWKLNPKERMNVNKIYTLMDQLSFGRNTLDMKMILKTVKKSLMIWPESLDFPEFIDWKGVMVFCKSIDDFTLINRILILSKRGKIRKYILDQLYKADSKFIQYNPND